MRPNFGKIDTIEFWITVMSILVITSIESLAIAKAIDKIDPYKRKTDLNKDLTGIWAEYHSSGLYRRLAHYFRNHSQYRKCA